MKLVLVNYEYPPLGGGAGNATACIVRALAHQGRQAVVVTGAYGDLRGVQQEGANLQVIRWTRAVGTPIVRVSRKCSASCSPPPEPCPDSCARIPPTA